MEFTFLGGASEVGASCLLLTVAGHRLLIDGGMRPAARADQSRLPDLALLKDAPPEAVIITHAHIDHTGALPLIASLYPGIPMYATESTRVLTEILLRDSIRIMKQEQLKPDGEIPLYSSEQVDHLLARMMPMDFERPFVPLPSVPSITLRYIRAGHILGAGMLFLETPEGTVLLTGDISVTDQRTVKGVDVQSLPHADIVVSEGTYGNRSHANRKDEERRLAETVQATLLRNGRILCPAFAVGRAQEIVLILKSYRASGMVSPVPIYLDGMVRTVCTAYQQQSHDLHPKLQRTLENSRRPLFADPDLAIFSVASHERAGLITRNTPHIIIASSGMLTGGASPLYAADLALREQDTILFSGYQDEESPGAAMLRSTTGESIRLGERTLPLVCQIARYNLSGHADADQIVHVVTRVAPKHLILVHGDPTVLAELARRFSHVVVAIPRNGETLVLHTSSSRSSSLLPERMQVRSPQTRRENETDREEHQEAKGPPTIDGLWNIANTAGPQRPWTAVELGKHYYGESYQPPLRDGIEQVLRNPSPYFAIRRFGAQTTYLPRQIQEITRTRPLLSLTAGQIVLVQAQQAAPQIALLLTPPEAGMVMMVGDQWKSGIRQVQYIQLVPPIRREDLLSVPHLEVKAQLGAWRKRIEQEWVDLFRLWKEARGHSIIYEDLCAAEEIPEQQLAWGLELLAHGRELFERDGNVWTPLSESRIRANEGFAHHLNLLEIPAGGAKVTVHGRTAPLPATLTGRSSWRLFEVRWEDGREAGQVGKTRASNIQLLCQQQTM